MPQKTLIVNPSVRFIEIPALLIAAGAGIKKIKDNLQNGSVVTNVDVQIFSGIHSAPVSFSIRNRSSTISIINEYSMAYHNGTTGRISLNWNGRIPIPQDDEWFLEMRSENHKTREYSLSGHYIYEEAVPS